MVVVVAAVLGALVVRRRGITYLSLPGSLVHR